MKVFALSDPHLSFGVPNKSMDRFGLEWVRHPEKIENNWREAVDSKDVVLVPGDISWARRLEDALPDLEWLDRLPGLKILLRGNHDHWWPTAAQLDRILPPSIRFVHNNHVRVGPCFFFGARLWDTVEYSVFDLIEWDPQKGEIPGMKSGPDQAAQEEIYEREIHRLKLSIASLPQNEPGVRVGLTHYPPLDHRLEPSRVSRLFEEAEASHVVFGHLHSIKKAWLGRAFGSRGGVEYHLTACDYIDFKPKLICEA
jgi:predicted phosphohydrolase